MRPCYFFFAMILSVVSVEAEEAPVDPALLAGLRARAIGPAGMSGRISSIDRVLSDPAVLYVGTAAGGVWKSTSGGVSWTPIFDDQPVASIGDVSIFQPSPDIVWVGTGEGNPRNSVSVGNGVYRSLDGGRTWRHLGLRKTERIHRVVLHPSNPDVAWVAAMGPTWGESPERGIFKTVDGGKSWRKVLYVNETTGGADLVIDPGNPQKLFAAMWDHRRWPWFFRSGGPGSGLYVSVDGGENWRRLTEKEGMPKGDLGRIGVAIAPSDPRIVYALVEAEKSALLRSRDGGWSWKTVNDEPGIAPRPFYYADIRVDPERPNRIYNLWSLASVSNDGGKSFEVLIPYSKIHPDHHALWIDPRDGRSLIDGNDGGIALSHDRGRTWQFAANLPLAQFYHVAVDMERPYHILGGMQDNGSWRGPAAVWENGGIRNQFWEEVGFGDGFETRSDPQNPLRGYSMSQRGFLMRWNLETGERKSIRPAPLTEGELRFNWNAAFAQDPFEPATIYLGSQFLHRSRDRGRTWEIVSPDLTTDNPDWQKQRDSGGLTPDVSGAENFTTLVAIAPSPIRKGVVWTGSDDGRIHVTRDGGETWISVEENLPDVPENTWVPHIEPSHFDPAVAYAVFDDHRRGNWTPYLYRTEDYGQTWTSLASDPVRGYALVVAEDPVNRDLLFLGTEFGLFWSMDRGKSWMAWRHGLPTTSVMDLAIHPRESDLVIATHGRSAFVLDDIRPLRQLTPEVVASPLYLFAIGDVQQYRVKQTGGSRFPGDGEFRGENRPYGALVTFWLGDESLPMPDKGKGGEPARVPPATERDPVGLDGPDSGAYAASSRGDDPGKFLLIADFRPRLDGEVPSKPLRVAALAGPPLAIPLNPEGAASGAAAMAKAPPPAESPEAGSSSIEEEDPEKPDAVPPVAEIEIFDTEGRRVRHFEPTVHRGLNRIVWGLRRDPFRTPKTAQWWADKPVGPELPPGDYRLVVRWREHQASQPLKILPDPRSPVSKAGRQARWEAMLRVGHLMEVVAEALERIDEIRADIGLVKKKVERKNGRLEPGEKPRYGELLHQAKELEKSLRKMEERLWQPPDVRDIVPDDDLLSKVGVAGWFIGSSWEEPSPEQLGYLKEAEKSLRKVLTDFNRLFDERVTAFRKRVEAAGIELFPPFEPLLIHPNTTR